jgi:hypothetical protein
MTFEPERIPADNMLFIDPHIHIISRTTDDNQAMRTAGVVAVIEPGFWVGQPRTRWELSKIISACWLDESVSARGSSACGIISPLGSKLRRPTTRGSPNR